MSTVEILSINFSHQENPNLSLYYYKFLLKICRTKKNMKQNFETLKQFLYEIAIITIYFFIFRVIF